MKKMQIFEPAMCCPTGICGVGVDPELLRISTVLNALQQKGIAIDRFNLTSAPMEFIKNKAVNDLLQNQGVEQLPAIVVDGEILITGRYPSNDEFARLLDVPVNALSEKAKPLSKITLPQKSSGCGCSDGNCC